MKQTVQQQLPQIVLISDIYLVQSVFTFRVFLLIYLLSSNLFQPQPAVFIQGQEPLTMPMLAAAPPNEQKQMLGERLFPLIQGMHPELAGKITGMLLEIDNSELIHMLEHQESLKSKVEEAVAVLQAHRYET